MIRSHDLYLATLSEFAARLDGGRRRTGTIVVGEPDRTGSAVATAYPLGATTVLFADPAVADRLRPLEGDVAISAEEFVASASTLGGELVGLGRQRVLDGALRPPEADVGDLVFRPLDLDDALDVERLARLADDCSDDDVDEADLDLDDLDPHVSALLAPDGRIAAYAGARPADIGSATASIVGTETADVDGAETSDLDAGLDSGFDDIAVLTHPAFRGRRLGALAVHEFVRHRRAREPRRRFLYRCNAANVASNHVAESLGFALVHTIAAVRFTDPPTPGGPDASTT